MPISFPLNPTIGQVYTYSGRSWTWDGRGWFPGVATGATGATGIQANLTAVASNIIPAANVTYDLGTSALRWRDLYLSGNSINLGGAVVTASNNSVVLPAGSFVGNVTIGSGGATVTVSNTVPATTTEGSLWLDSDTGDFAVYYGGGWAGVAAGPQGATGVSVVTSYIFEGGAPTTNYSNGPAFDCGGVN